MLNWEPEGDSNGIIIPRNIMDILGSSTGFKSELVKVTGAHKKEYEDHFLRQGGDRLQDWETKKRGLDEVKSRIILGFVIVFKEWRLGLHKLEINMMVTRHAQLIGSIPQPGDRLWVLSHDCRRTIY